MDTSPADTPGGFDGAAPGSEVSASVTVDDAGRVLVDGLVLDDGVLAGLLEGRDAGERVRVVERALSVGARGITSMGVGLDVAALDERVRRSVDVVTAEAEQRVSLLLAEARTAMEAAIDPERRTSMLARAMSDFTEWRDGFLRTVDPEVGTSHTGRLVGRLQEMLGPGGMLEERLTSALDPHADGSGLFRLHESIDRRFTELRELLAEQRGRETEAERGTAKGLDFEDALDDRLRAAARHLGAVVEWTGRTPGELGTDAVVGDYVVTLPSGSRIVVEAKNTSRIGLTGEGGILAELDRAMTNRGADVAICVSARDAFPREVGPFGVYGNRLLVVDDGEGTMAWVALRWAAAAVIAAGDGPSRIDPAAVADRLQRIRQMGQLFSSNRRSLTEIVGSVEKVRSSLDAMRTELVGLVDELTSELFRSEPGTVVELAREAG